MFCLLGFGVLSKNSFAKYEVINFYPIDLESKSPIMLAEVWKHISLVDIYNAVVTLENSQVILQLLNQCSHMTHETHS